MIEAEATATAKLLAPKTPNLSVEEVGALKLQAENLLLQVIKKQEVLLARGITRWAHNEFLQSFEKDQLKKCEALDFCGALF